MSQLDSERTNRHATRTRLPAELSAECRLTVKSYCFAACHPGPHGARWILPIAADGERIRPDAVTPPSPKNENSPLLTANGGDTINVAAPHETLVRALFAIVNPISTDR